jgi:hypothetical protein
LFVDGNWFHYYWENAARGMSASVMPRASTF